MAGEYATAAVIRSIEQAFVDSTDYPDATLLLWSTDIANPEIDARLLAVGFTVPITGTVPALITLIASQLCAAHGLDSYIGQFTANPAERAAKLREEARSLLEKVADGTFKISTLLPIAEGGAVIVDSDPETMHDMAAVVGEDWQWAWPVESRE
jgi:hypothetical protein